MERPHVVAAMLGHASVATTLGVYAVVTHVSLDALTEAINSRHHARVDLRVMSGETTPHDEGPNEGTELKSRFPSTESECRERESNLLLAPKLYSEPAASSGFDPLSDPFKDALGHPGAQLGSGSVSSLA
ncbi:MAG: hypothetical protein WB807_13370 [Candidatus Dormiibacterota bacterium]